MQLAWAAPGLIVGPIVGRMKDQKWLTAMMGVLTAIALVGLQIAPAWAVLWVPCLGFGTGAGMLLGLIFVGLRTNNASQTAALSGMVQCLGNLLAASGPPLAGKLHDTAGGWELPTAIATLLAIVMIVLGAVAGRSSTVSEPTN
ncbi:hypothetical protein [Novosphingobium arvoryzae]|uniref:Uncharacterized protein n=1 Tax=Novosphingobium arvoryzae TaxID=1256514 RepID=A0A918RLR6_9SPHN|nr:hypothetical protein [Novosphingobium arvoryzae]GHA02069.1 hypothetical protein GCM10011617_23650 [Novosphingobium arvoryzae]